MISEETQDLEKPALVFQVVFCACLDQVQV